MNRVDFTLDELRTILRDHPRAADWAADQSDYVYLRFGPEVTGKLRSEVMTTVEDRDLVIDVDDSGRVYGVELH